MHAEENPASPNPSLDKRIALVVALGFCVRIFDAFSKSLWHEELQRLYFAGAESNWGVIGRVHTDFQAPGYYLLLHLLNGFDAPLLRLASALASVATLIPLLALCRSSKLSEYAQLAVAGAFCFAPYQVWIGAELSPYPFLQLVIVSLAWAAFTGRASVRTRFAVFAMASTAGLYLHYSAAIAIVAVGLARVFAQHPTWLRLRSLFCAGLLGALAFLPWIIKSESAIARASRVTSAWSLHTEDFKPALLMIPRSFTAAFGDPVSLAAIITSLGAVIFFVTIALGLSRNFAPRTQEKPQPRMPLRASFITCLVAVAITLGLSPFLIPRIDEHYFALSAWGWALLAGVVVDAFAYASRARIAGWLLLSCVIAGTGHSFAESREDFREAVRIAREVGEGREAVYTGMLAQPWRYSSVTAFEIYAPELEAIEPLDVPREAETVIIITRANAIETQTDEWGRITGRRVFDEKIRIDNDIWVHVYVKPEGDNDHE